MATEAPPKTSPPSARIFHGDARTMPEIPDASVDLALTSPPYWQIKDYGAPGQVGWGQTLHEYLHDLARVWAECARVLRPGRRLCVNIGDQFARATVYGRYKVIPLHAEVIAQAQAAGLDYLGSIIWQKKTTMNPSGGAVVMGSFPHPPNGIVELDYEFILIFKKPGTVPPVSSEIKSESRLTIEEWKQFFLGHWYFGGTKQGSHEAMFPDELPRRLIRMFSFVGETVLDPFLGSGTTAKVACEQNRRAMGYELNTDFLPLIREKLAGRSCVIEPCAGKRPLAASPRGYTPQTEDAAPVANPVGLHEAARAPGIRVSEVVDHRTLLLGTGELISLLGIMVPPALFANAIAYLHQYVRGKEVILRFDPTADAAAASTAAPRPAYVQLTNKLFINRKMIEATLADADRSTPHKFLDRFVAAQAERTISAPAPLSVAKAKPTVPSEKRRRGRPRRNSADEAVVVPTELTLEF